MPTQLQYASACCLLVVAGCDGHQHSEDVEPPKFLSQGGEFEITWPPSNLGRAVAESETPLLNGKLHVNELEANDANAFQLHVTLERPSDEASRARWNETLAFPEYSWMAQVRVWDDEYEWLWPNLPYLLTAHGAEREDRYGGVDPSKGVDNDFAAVLIRPLRDNVDDKTAPMVAAQWHPIVEEEFDKHSIVHAARSDEFVARIAESDDVPTLGTLAVWLIYADFLGARTPAAWPAEKEFEGGILAYLEIQWKRSANGQFAFEVQQLVPPSGTGFDWKAWSTGDRALQKSLQMTLPP